MSEKIQIENFGDVSLTHRGGKPSETNYSLESSITESTNADPTIDEFKDQRSLKNALKSKVFIFTVIASVILLTVISVAYIMAFEMKKEVVTMEVKSWDDVLSEEQTAWYDKGLDEIKKAIAVKLNKRRAKNVVLFVGDGMGPNTVTAARIHGFKEEGFMTWEKFSHMGMLKTYCADKTVPDSFSTATALFGGVKVNYETGGVDSSVKLGDCKSSLDKEHHVKSILHMAQIDGMHTGFVTTTRVTHATPAALYAHVPDRRWECEAKMSDEQKQQGCKDIGRILVEDEPGRNINVIMGGGYQSLVSGAVGSPADPLDTWSCLSKDGRNLIEKWAEMKEDEGETFAVLRNNSDLNKLNTKDTDFVLGVFSNGHLKYDYERDQGPSGMPSLKDMTKKALEVLKSKKKGFLLVVEGGMIDQAHHRGAAKKAISETLALNEAVKETLKILKDRLDETLIIVTADHSHTLTINGYPEKGSSIFGISSKSKIDNVPYTSLTYATGHEGANQFEIDVDGKVTRRDPTLDDTESYEYNQQALIKTDENTHGGSDVTVHATGPMAHLFHRTHENTYVSHVIQYALRIGRFRDSSILESLAEFF